MSYDIVSVLEGPPGKAATVFGQARDLAPRWPYPVYDAAFTYLLLGEPGMAEELYERVDQMAPRGFFTCKASLDTLRRERVGELFPGFARATRAGCTRSSKACVAVPTPKRSASCLSTRPVSSPGG